MIINNIDISSLGVILYDRVLNTNYVDTTNEWLDGDIKPTYIRQQDKFKNIELTFLVLENEEESAFLKISKLTQLLKKATLKFDDLNLEFDVSLIGAGNPERLKNGNFLIKYNLESDYAKGEKEIYTTDANLTNSFKLNVLYYQNATDLIATESITIRASSFDGDNDTLEKIGINVDKYLPKYYNHGIATNLNGLEINYENLLLLGNLIINYSPITYNLTVNYYLSNNEGFYNQILQTVINFTYPQLKQLKTIGQLIDTKSFKPEGYRSRIGYDGELTVEELLASSPISVFYDKIENELSKNIIVKYFKENDNEEYEIIDTALVNIKESDYYDGITLSDIINIEAHRPDSLYYNSGYIEGYNSNQLISYDTTEAEYIVKYSRQINTVFVEYYAGTYPGWYRLSTATLALKYKDSYNTDFTLDDIGIDINRYHTAEYETGNIYNYDIYNNFESVITAGVIQVYYKPINFTIQVDFIVNGETNRQEFTINALNFFNDPILSDIIPINNYKPEGYQLDVNNSYNGPITLAALTQASPIQIAYEEIEAVKTKNVIIKYKQEMSMAYSTINTSLVVVSEADCVGGVRLKDIFNLNAYKPDYYENGIINGYSSTSIITFDEIESNYEILYVASSYNIPVRYYIDEVNELNWIGSSSLSYRVIDFASDTTLVSLGLNINEFKPTYCEDGAIQYTGPINFVALQNLSSIDIVYVKTQEPEIPEGIDYPHRFLFLQHNDLGDYENYHPEWTMNHAYINTGVVVDDMSKLSVVMECKRVDENVPLHEVNAGYAYLFGSSSGLGSFYMRFNNQTQYGTNLTGVNTYEAKAGYYTNQLTLTEESAIGFSENSGIYQSERPGYSYATFTYTNQLQSENAQMPYPLYLFANNKGGSYEGGLAGIGIYGCRIYYDNVLIRDMIPVQFYDKIGDQVAPSNCLYDKITKTFFEDATGQDSFNIIDDDRYIDTNLEHKIGHCYVKYFKGTEQFKTMAIWFRASDFVDKIWDPYEHFLVDENQPAYYKPGVIENFKDLVFDFDNLNNNIYNVIYEEQDNKIFVNYYREDENGNRTLIKEETIPISEKDFYQVPTFGDIVRLNKYKPEGYKTDFVYPDTKITLGRVLSHSPYNIIYTPETEELQTYTTVIRYIKKIFGIRNYEVIGTKTLSFDQTNFRDGEYIDFYIDKNLMKPTNDYYEDGIPYEWYEMDEMIDTPDKLKNTYTIVYETKPVYININYYTDEPDEANLIASTTWGIKLDDFDGEFYIVDQLPNEYINKYKPVICDGGILQDSSKLWTFEELAQVGEIKIVYMTIIEPDDPESASYEQKVLCWGNLDNELYLTDFFGGLIPYIDLGYRPKEINRLRVEITCYAQSSGFQGKSSPYGMCVPDYTYFFGYYGPTIPNYIGESQALLKNIVNSGGGMTEKLNSNISPGSKGCFAIRCRLPLASGWVYSAEGPQYIDGQTYYTASSAPGVIAGNPTMVKAGIGAYYRRGKYADTDNDYNEFIPFKNYGITSEFTIKDTGHPRITDGEMQIRTLPGKTLAVANPFTIIMDAYNNYFSVYNYDNSNTPFISSPENNDIDIFEDREQPRGTLSLFQTTNPTTGKVNIMPWNLITYPHLGLSGSNSLSGSYVGYNPFKDTDYSGGITEEILTITGYAPDGSPIYEKKSQYRNIKYAEFQIPVYPQMSGAAVWRVKIYDRNRLVRDLIPVAKNDKVYDYVMPDNGLFDLITEIFFGNSNMGGEYKTESYFVNDQGDMILSQATKTIAPEDVYSLYCIPDLITYGKITTNYYDYDNKFIANAYVNVPTWFCGDNDTIENILEYNNYKPDDFHLDGMLDLDADLSFEKLRLSELYEMGTANVYYKLRTFTKTIVYYKDNVRIGSKDIFYSLKDIQNATTIADLGIDLDLYYDENYKHGRIVFNESIIANDDIKAFIDAPSPIVVYDKYTKEEAPNLLYLEYYRGGAYEDGLITIDKENPNYLNCDLDGVVLNPNGAIKYYNHYHSALYEDEVFDYFIPYQVRVIDKYTGIHSGPAKKYKTLAMIVDQDIYTIVEERNGWGRIKEYNPKGWILLNATEPISGPGQNPDYDIADQEVATVPFKERVHITKLTIDRLWCYVPELESWIKAEDISYDQAGKLYNGLGINVINLDNIDFSSVSSLEDMGIYPEAKKLRFHNYTNYSYSGEYTYEAFSNLHEIDFVYPETIYNYTCIYYKDNKNDSNELGRSGFSCSISDWNPDWDTFISTSWLVDEDGNEINPTLYRDTELTLTWDYFGFEKNLFRPDGYGEGIYMWNPRSWDRKNIKFSFQELIRCGTQYVFYPIFEPDTYKLYVRENCIGKRYAGTSNQYYIYNTGGIITRVNDDSAPDKYLNTFDPDISEEITYTTPEKIPYAYDIFTEGEFINPEESIDGVVSASSTQLWGEGIVRTFGSNNLTSLKFLKGSYIGLLDTSNNTYYPTDVYEQLQTITPGCSVVFNFSNIRKNQSPTVVFGYGNVYENREYKYFASKKATGDEKYRNATPIYDNTNLKADYFNTLINTMPNSTNQTKYCLWNILPGTSKWANTNEVDAYKYESRQFGMLYNTISYKNFMMIHYWVPVPKGLWYIYNNEELRIPDNGMFDLLTGEFTRSYRLSDGNIGTSYTVQNDGQDIIFLRKAQFDLNNAYDYFSDWHYEANDCNYLVKLNNEIQTYKNPDLYAIKLGKLNQHLVLPITKYTSDSSNKVIGEWYFSCGKWFESSNATIYAGDFDTARLEEKYSNITLLQNSDQTLTFYTYLDPEAVVNPGEASDYSYGAKSAIITIYYQYTDAEGNIYYFDGSMWVPKSYTSLNRTEVNKTYAVSRDTPYYSVPIANDEYKITNYLYGERVSILYIANNDTNWGYTGKGWVQIEGNLSEVLQ